MQNLSSTIKSYLVSLISKPLSKYTTNFDSQQDLELRLWTGEGRLNCLELDVEEINKELVKSPLALVSGRLGNLYIKVPWKTINSESVLVTIEDLDIRVRVKSIQEASKQVNMNKSLKPKKKSQKSEDDNEGGWGASFGVKIASNVSVICKAASFTLIDKDFQLTISVQSIQMDAVNALWIPEYLNISKQNPTVRQLFHLIGMRVSLGKSQQMELLAEMNSSLIRLSRELDSNSTFTSRVIRMAIWSEKCLVSFSKNQVPLLIRLFQLLDILSYIQDNIINPPLPVTKASRIEESAVVQSLKWFFNNLPVLPVTYTIGKKSSQKIISSKKLNIGIYVDKIIIKLKLDSDAGDVEGILGGVFFEVCDNKEDLSLHLLMGISMIVIIPTEFPAEPFLNCGELTKDYLQKSLYFNMDKNIHDSGWREYIMTISPEALHHRAKSIAVDIWIVRNPSKERSDAKERLTRIVAGPMKIKLNPNLGVIFNECLEMFSDINEKVPFSDDNETSSSSVKDTVQVFMFGTTIKLF